MGADNELIFSKPLYIHYSGFSDVMEPQPVMLEQRKAYFLCYNGRLFLSDVWTPQVRSCVAGIVFFDTSVRSERGFIRYKGHFAPLLDTKFRASYGENKCVSNNQCSFDLGELVVLEEKQSPNRRLKFMVSADTARPQMLNA